MMELDRIWYVEYKSRNEIETPHSLRQNNPEVHLQLPWLPFIVELSNKTMNMEDRSRVKLHFIFKYADIRINKLMSFWHHSTFMGRGG